jgi:Mrp family chromosome partitioning ATPase
MSSQELPVVITAISDAQFEGFVSGTLFAQGWSVVFRAIDTEALERFCSNNVEQAASSLLIYSPDLPGITHDVVKRLTTKVKQVVGFSSKTNLEFADLHPNPATATDLVSIVRGFVRAPMLRQVSQMSRANRKAHVVAIGSAGSDTGCTTIALNLAMELSVLGKSTLLIDANFRAPSIAALIAIRNVQSESGWRTIAPQLAIAEITQQEAGTIDQLMESATQIFDNIVIDLGSISGLSNRLTDRRWTSTMTTWSCDQGDELMVIARPDLLGIHRLEQVCGLLEKTSIRAALSFTLNMRSQGKKGADEEAQFLAITTRLRPLCVRTISRDLRAASKALAEKATLIEVNMRSALRKSIATMASELKR